MPGVAVELYSSWHSAASWSTQAWSAHSPDTGVPVEWQAGVSGAPLTATCSSKGWSGATARKRSFGIGAKEAPLSTDQVTPSVELLAPAGSVVKVVLSRKEYETPVHSLMLAVETGVLSLGSC